MVARLSYLLSSFFLEIKVSGMISKSLRVELELSCAFTAGSCEGVFMLWHSTL